MIEITQEQSIAYTEVLEVLRHITRQDFQKIPSNIINYYNSHKAENYNFSIDESKPFAEQKLSKKTKVILAILFRDYWATEEEREKIKKNESNDLIKLEEEKRKQYNTDELFQKDNNHISNSLSITEYKKPKWYQKLWMSIIGKLKK